MPWKQGYTISDERGLRDDELAWPNGARCCVAITIDLSVATGAEGITQRDITSDKAQFGAREGLAQLRQVLTRHHLRATIATPAVIAQAFPENVRALVADGHEIAAQGLLHEDVSALNRAEEEARIAQATEILTAIAGARPTGWFSLPRPGDPFAGGTISPHTMDLLIDAGFAYMGNGLADDIPHYWVTDFATRRAILTLPYYYHYDDQFFLLFPAKGTGLEHPDALARNWRAEFAAQYRRGRMFHCTLHPHAIGFAHRIHLLDEFLTHLRAHPGIYNPTGAELARHWASAHPPATHLRLAPSIWRDYPGSLS